MANALRKLKLGELSLVDKGANQHAAVTIFKRATDPLAETIAKFYGEEKPVKAKDFSELLASNESREKLWEVREELYPLFNALQDSVNTILSDDSVTMAEKMPRIERNVSDFLVAVRDKMPDVEEELMKFFNELTAEALGTIAKTEESQMANTKTVEDVTKTLDETTAKLAEVTAKLEKAEALAKMSDGEKAYMAKMSEDEKAAFMAMSPADRAKKMEGVKKNDETITVGGETVSKSAVGDEQFAVLKRLATAETEIAKVREEAEIARLEKRAADEFANLPGTDTEKARVLKAIGALGEAEKASLEVVMKIANEANAKAFETVGKKAGEVENSPEAKLEKRAREIAADRKVSFEKGYVIALEEDPTLYNEVA